MKVVHTNVSYFSEASQTLYIDASKRLLPLIFDCGHELAHFVIHKLGLSLKFQLIYDVFCPQGLVGRAKTGNLLPYLRCSASRKTGLGAQKFS